MALTNFKTSTFFSDRISQVPRSFIRDILKVAVSPEIISFAGGLPNKSFFPSEQLKESAIRILSNQPSESLQYSETMGYRKLRESIAENYRKKGWSIDVENILITTGSQQALDLIGKVFINEHAPVIMEEPAYLGAIQAFSMFRPDFITVPLLNDGLDLNEFDNALGKSEAKIAYLVTNFQNPTGISYSEEKRMSIAECAVKNNMLIIEDDPYGLIRFTGTPKENIFAFAPKNTILLGTFSKTVVPGLRVGWIVASSEYIEKLEVAKQAADLHTDIFAQRLIYDFLRHNNLDDHLKKIKDAYGNQANAMMDAIREYFPSDILFTEPEGGMFLWVTLPKAYSSMKLFDLAIEKKVAFVPGVPFYIGKSDSNALRLNFSCSNPDEIQEGIKRLAKCIYNL
jgi:2-aminoadipate transaminase